MAVILSPGVYFAYACTLAWTIDVVRSVIRARNEIDRLTEKKRRTAQMSCATPSRSGPAAHMIPEVQLHIFTLLRTQARFGVHQRPFCVSAYFPRDPEVSCRPRRGLLALCYVCKGWRGAATEVLYHDVVLPNARSVQAFATTLSMQPALALFVRRLVMADAEAKDSITVERIVRLCSGARDISFFRTEPSLFAVPGLYASAHRLRRLVIKGGHHNPSLVGPYNPPVFDVTSALPLFPNLDSLLLTRERIAFKPGAMRPPGMLVLRNIHTLSVQCCSLEMPTLARLLASMPRLRTAELRNMIYRNAAANRTDVAALFAAQRGTLTELSLASTYRGTRSIALCALGGIARFSALRVLALNAHELPQVPDLPPALEQLVLSFSPYSAYASRGLRRRLLCSVAEIIRLAAWAPALRSIQLWDEVCLAQIPVWRLAAFMLREILGRAAIEVDVNLFLEAEDLQWCQTRLFVRGVLRRIYYQ
ncbi:hypothetical protein AURDEDRAFT_185085 [Auricularia subglabra TFB-10046 SS5]|nr:hypothetical protein AURDEDRAFT_185085 [Auricularia subglabra TFB-10046 SS5]